MEYKLCHKCGVNYIGKQEDICEECEDYEREMARDYWFDIGGDYGGPDLGYHEDIENDKIWRPRMKTIMVRLITKNDLDDYLIA